MSYIVGYNINKHEDFKTFQVAKQTKLKTAIINSDTLEPEEIECQFRKLKVYTHKI